MEKMIFSSYEITNSIKETIADGGHFPLEVTGTSMQPFLIQGRDVVWLCKCDVSEIKKGAILLFERKDRSLVLHRVREVLPNGELLMNGDAQTWCEKISCDQVIAVVNEIERNGKKIKCGTPADDFKILLWRGTKPVRYYILRIWKMFRR
ncbi:MAG: S24/S26 family peptidase [Clostridia bacterium]|nr:S24/S26 family peptidase [Clostridia bacterium]